jgi:RNA methyltransferase, TrmH family
MEILSKNKLSLFRKLNQKKYRDETGLFLIEGLRLAEEAINAKIFLEAVIIRNNSDTPVWLGKAKESVEFFGANQTQMDQLSDTKTPQAVILIGRIPEVKIWQNQHSPLTLAVDRIRDPGNFGTILRTASWFGVNQIVPSEDCVDVYSPKVVRASMGALFHVDVYKAVDLDTFINDWEGNVLSLDMHGEPIENIDKTPETLLVIGSEAHGVSRNILKNSTPIRISKKGTGESLNAGIAAGIALWELTS